MLNRKVLYVLLLVGVILLAVAVGPRVVATARAIPPDAAVASSGVTVPYPGRLDNAAGQAVADGAYDFTFALYDAATGGEPLWSEVQESIAVKDGGFIASLGRVHPIPEAVLSGSERWVAVSVRGPGESDFNALLPRQRLSTAAPASPAAGAACAHDHWGESWTGTGLGLSLESSGGGSQAQLISLLAGVYGYHDVFYGVLGKSNSNGIGVGGDSANKYGVWGHSTNSYGGWFESDQDHLDLALGGAVGRLNSDPNNENSVLYLSSNADVIIKLDNDGGENNVFRIKNSGGSDTCTVDESGNLTCTGTKSAVVGTASHGQRLLYAVESPEVWFEDVGAASLENGKTTVAFDPVFAETVNTGVGYHVFLTPLCQDPVLLFVTSKDANGFTVRGVTLDGKPSACAFDYRIIAKRLGAEGTRLEQANWQKESQ